MFLQKSKISFFFILLGFAIFLPKNTYADTVYLKDGANLKGIVVANYKDRILYSTIDGEKEILKSEIGRIEYDEALDNLIKMGDSSFEKGYYRTAFKYYLMAQEINPDIPSLNDKIFHTETIIAKAPELRKREHLAMKNEIISGRTSSFSPVKRYELEKELKRDMGIAVSRNEDGRFYVEGLTKNSSFRKAGVRDGDAMISVWSLLCSYLVFEDLCGILTRPEEAMIALVIERKLTLRDDLPFNAKIAMKWEGATIDTVKGKGAAKKTGLKEEDLIIAVGDTPIRYTPLKNVLKMINERRPGTTITVQRKLTVFK